MSLLITFLPTACKQAMDSPTGSKVTNRHTLWKTLTSFPQVFFLLIFSKKPKTNPPPILRTFVLSPTGSGFAEGNHLEVVLCFYGLTAGTAEPPFGLLSDIGLLRNRVQSLHHLPMVESGTSRTSEILASVRPSDLIERAWSRFSWSVEVLPLPPTKPPLWPLLAWISLV